MIAVYIHVTQERKPAPMAIFKEKLLCPVCYTALGNRYKNELYTAHCPDCKAQYTWKPGKDKPEALLDSQRPEGCNCLNCRK